MMSKNYSFHTFCKIFTPQQGYMSVDYGYFFVLSAIYSL